MLAIDRRDFYGLEVGRQDDLKHFDVFAVSKLAMTNLRWLMHTRPCFEPNWALTFTFEFNPTLEHRPTESSCREGVAYLRRDASFSR